MSGEKNNEETGSDFITSKLLKSRSVVISQQVDSKLSEKILNQIVLLEQEGGEILKEVWGYTPERHVDTRVVDVHISRLRSKLEDDPANPELILTARGTGYLFQRIVDSMIPEGS